MLNNFDYSMFPAKHFYNTELVMPLLVAKFENQKLNMSILSMLLLLSIKHSYDTELVMFTLVTRFEN